MRELALLLLLLLPPCGDALAQATVTGARVAASGVVGAPAQNRAIAAAPGVRFGLDVVPEGTPQGAPVVLEVRLTRDQDPPDAPDIRWQVAARVGTPARCAWEFASDWEIVPGVWTMTVYYEDKELASASFDVARAEAPPVAQSPAPAPDQAPLAKRPEARQAKSPPQSPDRAAPSATGAAKTRKAGEAQPPAPGDKPPVAAKAEAPSRVQPSPSPQPAGGPVGGRSDRRVYALLAGSFSTEARAQWVAAFLKGQGARACVRVQDRDGRKLWTVVAGWRDTPEDARRARDELAPLAGDVLVRAMSAGELEKGMECR